MNVPDAWVKEVCEKLGIAEPSNPIGVFWDGDFDLCNFIVGKMTDEDTSDSYPYNLNDGDGTYEHFKPLSSGTIAMIKKDLGIE